MKPPSTRRWDDQLSPGQLRRMRKGMYILPSLFTAANMGAGYFAIYNTLLGSQAEAGYFDIAAKAIGIAVVADGLDGFVARLTGTTSDFGREFDSLADAITFGVAPALLALMWGFRWFVLADFETGPMVEWVRHLGLFASFLFLVAGASRLARFNIQVNPQPSNPGRPGKKYFVGMPIPAGAGVIASTVHLNSGHPINFWWLALVWTAMLVVVAFLMVSTWRFYSFKDLKLRSRHPFQLVVLLGGLIYLVVLFSGPVLFAIAITYMLSGVMSRLSFVFRRRPSQPAPPPLEEAPQTR
ncbi:MAG TPA: phosphatidylcholine/phosphatidylserine synthase [Candidatus Angelobacter sp.]|jgi:CDP-diacylglycerol---serine O-phosphatidyltransferase|nr:phosphatidylcholine/phosphatidylserine synthase [Candidatus Angelobacter sp.]HKT51991.1 phosphatidylcholine/phosphatidylserine synthase [Candidatus Angelobacter sp.]